MQRLLLALFALFATSCNANAVCLILGVSSASLSTAIPAGILSNTSQNAIPTTLSISFAASVGTSSGCSVAFKISGTLTSSGGATIPYSISTSSSGSPTVSYTTNLGSSAPVTPTTVSVPLFLIIPAGVYRPGTYIDSTARVEAYNSIAPITLLASRAVTPTLQVTQTYCTIGGTTNGGSKTLDFSNGATVSTVQQTANFGTVICNNTATISLSSAKGAATNAASAVTGFQNYFDYVAQTTINGGTAILDTAANPAVGSSESATGNITAVTTVNAPFSVRVTPRAPAKPLMPGAYSDVLTVTITAN